MKSRHEFPRRLMQSAAMVGMVIAFFSGCAATGDWHDDSIFFDRRLAEKRLNAQRKQLAQAQRATADETIQQATLRQQVAEQQDTVNANQNRIRELKGEKQAAELKLARVEADILTAKADGVETQQLRDERQDLRRQINHLDNLLADIIELR